LTTNKQADMNDLVGTLLEAALRDQDAVRMSVNGLNRTRTSLDTAVNQLPQTVSSKVEASLKEAIDEAAQTLLKKFHRANTNAFAAADAYEKAAKFALRRIVAWSLGITALFAASIVGVAWIVLPSLSDLEARRAEVQSRREEIEKLESRIAWLTAIEKSDITWCKVGPRKVRPCAKLDPQFQNVWDGGYQILASKEH